MHDRNTSVLPHALVLVLLCTWLWACDSHEPGKAAPIGDHAVLEQLASAYRTIAEEYPVQPTSMKPAARKKFVERVFVTAGFHYGASLTAFAEHGADVTNQDQRDLAELLFLPRRGLNENGMKEIFTEEELAAIHSIETGLK